jgi:hypothetical protein
MESKNLIIAGIWTFMLTTILILNWQDTGLIFTGYLLLFFIALISTTAVGFWIPEAKSELELVKELKDLKTKLNEFTKEAGTIKN